ncbi:MAG: hypothetical protein GXO44_03215, partial [Deferribacteres bacterium]|nr:hypothetical protein [Deferribacteres bacterium]
MRLSRGVYLVAVALLIPMVLGFYVRIKAYSYWKQYPNVFFVEDNRPIFTTMDAYYYARLSREIVEGKYKPGKIDKLRGVPHQVLYPKIPPLLSSITAGLLRLLGVKYPEALSVWLIPLFAVLVVVPLVLMGVLIGAVEVGFIASILTVVSFIYLIRSSICRFDTDTLNLFFAV